MAEGARLESVLARKSHAGSNPVFSVYTKIAYFSKKTLTNQGFFAILTTALKIQKKVRTQGCERKKK